MAAAGADGHGGHVQDDGHASGAARARCGDVGEPGTGAAREVFHLPLPGGLRPAGIGGMVGQQGKQKIGSHQGDGDQDGLEDPLCT